MLLACWAPAARAHPVSLTVALVNAREDGVVVDFSMMVEDLILYYWMETGDDFRFPQADLKARARGHAEFLLRHLQLMDRDGNRFEGSLVDIDFSDLPEEGVHIDELMAHSLVYRFTYAYSGELPDFLTVAQNFGGDEPAVPAEMRVRLFHHGVLMDTATLAHGNAHTTRLDWGAGWERAADNLEEARARLRQRREETLGITSYSSVYSFVYVTDTEVRHEVLVPLLTLETWLPLERENPERMTVSEQRATAGDILEFFRRHNRMEIDGEPVEPALDRLQFFGPEIQDFARRAPERDVTVFSARVGVILSFPTGRSPETVAMRWDHFTETMPRLRSVFYYFEDGLQGVEFTPARAEFVWENPGGRGPAELLDVPLPERVPPMRLPVFSIVLIGMGVAGGIGWWRADRRGVRLGCAAAAVALVLAAALIHPRGSVPLENPLARPPPVENGEALFAKLHHNLYRAFDHRREDRIYDVLAATVAGPLLEEIYLQIRRGLVMEEQGGAVSRIRSMELKEVNPLPGNGAGRPAFSVRADWTVTGTVEHWGHFHTRTNRHQARFDLTGLEEGWRITGFEPLAEERVGLQIGLRR